MEQSEKGLDMFPFYVVVVGGKNVGSANSENIPSPYLVLQIRNFKVPLKSRQKAHHKTKPAKETRDPIWNQIFNFQYIDITETLTVECLDDKSGELFGEFKVKGYKIQQLIEEDHGVQKFSLKDKRLNIGGTKEELGDIYLEFSYDWKWNVTISPKRVFDLVTVDAAMSQKLFLNTTVLNYGKYHFHTSISDSGWEDESHEVLNLSGFHKIQISCYSITTKKPIGESVIEIDSLRDGIELGEEKLCQVELLEDSVPKGLLEFKVKIEEHIEVNEIAKNDTILIDVVGLTNVPSFRKNGLSSPLVMVKTKSGKVWSTECVKDTIHPMWQHAEFQLENAENEDTITFECYSEKKSKQQCLGYTSMKIADLKSLVQKKSSWDLGHVELLDRYSKSISKKFMSETMDELSISKGLEYIGDAKKNFLREKRFNTEREKLVYQSLWINMTVDATVRSVSERLRNDGLRVIEMYMDKVTKSLYAKNLQLDLNPETMSRNERLSKTISKGGEKLSMLKHSALTQLKDQKTLSKLQDKIKEAENDNKKLLELVRVQYIASYAVLEARTVFGEIDLSETSIVTQLILSVKLQDPIVTLRNKQTERQRKKNQGLVYRVKQARATYKFVTNTKVADVKVVEILKAFRGNIRKGNISRKKFEKVIKEFELEDFPIDFFFALFDREKKGYVEFKTLVQGFNLIMKGTPEEKLQLAFDAFSSGTNGYMSREDMKDFLKMVIVNASKLLERLLKTIKEGLKDIKEDVVTTRTFQRAINITQQSVGVSEDTRARTVSRRRYESKNTELALDHSSSIHESEGQAMRPRKDSRDARKTIDFTGVSSPQKVYSQSDLPLAPKTPSTKTLSDSRNRTVSQNTTNPATNKIPDSRRHSLMLKHERAASDGAVPFLESPSVSNSLTNSMKAGTDSPEVSGTGPGELGNSAHKEDRDLAKTLLSFLNDTTINNIVNFCFKIMGCSKEEFMTFDKILEFAKNEPIIANFFGFVNTGSVEKSKKKKKKKKSNFSVYKMYITFLYIEEKGGITKKALKDALDILDIDSSIIPLDTIFLLFDRNDTGILDFSDLFNALGTLLSGDMDDKLELIFSIIDRNGIGRASRQDVFYLLHSLFKNTAKLISKLGKVLPGKFAEKTTDSICEALTKDNTIRHLVSLCFFQAATADANSISLQEFKAWVVSEPIIQQLLSSSSKSHKVFIKSVDFPLLRHKISPSDVKSFALANRVTALENEVRALWHEKKIVSNELKLIVETQTEMKTQSLIIQDRCSKLPMEAQQEKDRLTEQIDYLNSHISPQQVEAKKNEIMEIGNKIKLQSKDLEDLAKETFESVRAYYLSDFILRKEVPELESAVLRRNTITFSEVLNIFKEFAQNGGITKEDLASIIKMLGLTTFPIDFLFHVFDKDKDNILNFGELIGTLTTLIGTSGDDKFKLVFDAFDLDRVGILHYEEIQYFFRTISSKDQEKEIQETVDLALRKFWITKTLVDESSTKEEVIALAVKALQVNMVEFKSICYSVSDDSPFIRKYFLNEEGLSVRMLKGTLNMIGNKVLESNYDIKTTFESFSKVAKEMSQSSSNPLASLPKPYKSDGVWEKHVLKSRKLKEIRAERWRLLKEILFILVVLSLAFLVWSLSIAKRFILG